MFGQILAKKLFSSEIAKNNAHFYALKNYSFKDNRKTSHYGWFFLKKSDFEGKTFLLQELLSLHQKYKQFYIFCQSHLKLIINHKIRKESDYGFKQSQFDR